MSNNSAIRDKIAQNDVTVMRSYLEVDVAEWFSNNEIPFGYEAFTIPSVVGPGKKKWENVTEAIRGVGKGERESVTLPSGEEMDAFAILDLWNEIYEKHRLMDEQVSIPPREALANFQKQMLLPDFSIYKDADIRTVKGDFNWGDYDYLVEVSGLYGVGLPDEADEDEWWDWYRVSAVAFKELAYRLLGLWDKTYWVVPNQPYIEGGPDGIPRPLRDDDHYIIMNTTQAELGLDELADKLGITADPIQQGLSPSIQPIEYKRPLDSTGPYEYGQVTPVKYTWDGINYDNVDQNENAVIIEDQYVVFHGELGEVYIHDAHAHVRESQWRGTNMMMLREYVLDVISQLEEDGIIEGVRKVNEQ